MIRLQSMEMHNFGIYKGTVKLDFEGKSIIGILAEYASDKKRSNRSGKTLILEAIRYNLTGLTRAKKEVSMIHEGEEVMSVHCVYIDDEYPEKDIVIRRGRDYKANGVLELNWIEKTRESQEAINDMFGISKDDFDLTSFFKQADINGFMDLSPTEKTTHLMKWLDNEHWKVKEEKVKSDIKHFKEKLKENDAVIKALSDGVEVGEEIDIELEQLKKENVSLSKEITKETIAKEKAEKMLNKLHSDVDSFEEKHSDLSRRIKRCKDSISQIKDLREEYEEKKDKIAKLNEEIGAEPDDKLDDLKHEISGLKHGMRQKKSHLEMMEEKSEGLCPILNETCDRIKSNPADIKKYKEDIKKDQNKIDQLLKDCSVIEDYNDKAKVVERLENGFKGIAQRIKDLKPKDDVKELIGQLDELKRPSELSLEPLENEISDAKNYINERTKKIRGNDQRIGALENRKNNAEKSLDQIEELSEKNEKIQKRLEDLTYLAMMFGKNGIPADEIENAFHEIQDDINFVLKDLNCGLTVSFSPDKELQKWEPFCHCGHKFSKGYKGKGCPECDAPRMKQRKDEISLKILENGVEKDFSMDSGGGKTIISYAVRTALTMLKRRQNKTRLNMLFLDEVDSALDGHLASSIIDSITKTLTKKLGYDQIMLVSHKDEIKNAVPNILKVTRFDDYSTAKFV